MRTRFILLAIAFLLPASGLLAQDALPHISVKKFNGKVIVSWLNDYNKVARVINIQRSYDSLRNYISIGSVLNPQNRENGYADEKPPYGNMYYRVFVAFDGGSYAFSNVARPGAPVLFNASLSTADSIALYHIKATIPVSLNHIYTGRENNVTISLPDAETKKYAVKFFDENNKLLFELNKIRDDFLVVDKTNFVHAGWFGYEIYEKGKLVEKNKFYLPKEDKVQALPPAEKGKKNK
jgi:hypothetical protein